MPKTYSICDKYSVVRIGNIVIGFPYTDDI